MAYFQAFSPLQTSRSALGVTLSLYARPAGELLPCSSLPTVQLQLGGFTHTAQLSKSFYSLRNLEHFIMSLGLTPQDR